MEEGVLNLAALQMDVFLRVVYRLCVFLCAGISREGWNSRCVLVFHGMNN